MQAQNELAISFDQNKNQTASYQESVNFYQTLAKSSKLVSCKAFGSTDSGKPLHEVIIDLDGGFKPNENKARLFINNAIHPGEPCGVDATMMLARAIVSDKDIQRKLKNTQIIIIPFYNIGGGLNRNKHSRANQNGPEEYGFRGNAKNLDLNRDFVKCDTKNAQSFNQLFIKWSPHIMIDNHTSNGADYQYTMTLIATQKDKLAAPLSSLMTEEMLPFLYKDMADRDWEMIPYVYVNGVPDNGIYGFMDLPRYSSGYAAMHHTIAFMPETHMLKSYEDRVLSTEAFMLSMIDYIDANEKVIRAKKQEAINQSQGLDKIAVHWKLDMEKVDKLLFKGYEAKYKASNVSGADRLYYDRSSEFEKEVDFFNSYNPSTEILVPKQYIIPQAYHRVIDRLKWNGVKLKRLEEDKTMEVSLYKVEDYETTSGPYEGHYLHSNVQLSDKLVTVQYFAGDYVIDTNQAARNYIVSVLEPEAPDSFFAWNFFDGILMQKEHFSAYVFEDRATEILENHPHVKTELEEKRSSDEDFKNDAAAQLNFVYEHSHHHEPTYKRYPIGRIMK